MMPHDAFRAPWKFLAELFGELGGCPSATKRRRPPSPTKSTMCIWQSAAPWICRRPRAGSTIYDEELQNCVRINVASVLERFGGQYVAVAIFGFIDSQNWPLPTAVTHWINAEPPR